MTINAHDHTMRVGPGGLLEPIGAPAWLGSLVIDQWTALANTNVAQDVQAPDLGQTGNTKQKAVMEAWSGAAYLPGYGAAGSLLHYGGGHQDYYGNEVYSFDLDSLTWVRLNLPSNGYDWSAAYTDGILPDGKPRVPHTYYYITSDGVNLLILKREIDNVGANTVNALNLFNPNTLTWDIVATENPGLGQTNYDGCVYDPVRDLIWQIKNLPVGWSSVPISGGAWTDYPEPTGNYNPRAGSVYIPGEDKVLSFPQGTAFFLDPANPTADKVDLTATGTAPTFGQGDAAHWSNNLGAVVYYPSRSSAVYLLTMGASWSDSWTWSQITMTGTVGTITGDNPTFHKMQLIEWGAATVLVMNADWTGPAVAARLT